MKERVLITGASGFVGYHLVKAALQAGLEVWAGVRSSSNLAHLKALDIRYVTLDYLDVRSIRKELEDRQFQYVIHAAGTTKAKNEQQYQQVNADYTKNLALAAESAYMPLKKFVFISSLAALGPIKYESRGRILEHSPARPLTAYGRSKLMAEQQLAAMDSLPYVVLRPTAVYGPREKDIFLLLKTLNSGLDPYIGWQHQRLSFVHVEDVARAALQALKAKEERVSYNLSDGHSYSRYALADISKRVLGKRALRFHVPLALVKVAAKAMELAYTGKEALPALNREKLLELSAPNWNCSIEKISTALGFVPEYDLEKGLTQTLQWYKTNKWL